jgi:beta-galactosidase GanA
MVKNPPKIKGATGACFKCGAMISCNEKAYNGTVTLQWQGTDGKAHYKKIGEEFVCGNGFSAQTNTPSVVTETIVNWTVIPEEEQSDDMKQLIAGLNGMRALAYQNAKELHSDMNVNSNTFGQIVNANMTHLIQLAKVKAIKEIKR